MKIVVWNLLLMTTPYPSLGVLYFLYYFFASIREGWNSRRGAACFHASTPTFWTTNLECLEWNFSSHSFHLRRARASVATPRFIHGLSFWPNCRCHQIEKLEKLWVEKPNALAPSSEETIRYTNDGWIWQALQGDAHSSIVIHISPLFEKLASLRIQMRRSGAIQLSKLASAKKRREKMGRTTWTTSIAKRNF